MRVETNLRLAQRNRQIAQYLFFLSFGVLILGLFVSNAQVTNSSTQDGFLLGVLLPSLVLPLAFVLTMLSVRMTNLWVRQPRPEVVIRDGLKGISNKSVLYNYHFIPARHVLIAPQGVFAMVTRFQDGRFTVEGDSWKSHRSAISRLFSIFRLDAIGNPTLDAQNAAARLQKIIEPIAPGVPVYPLIVFVDPRAQVEMLNPTVPVLYADRKRDPNLNDYLRDLAKEKRPTLTPAQIEAFEAATIHRK
jgi:hypothetical protein